ncbi:hypothetical protein AGMMS49545_23460 [Betaproteobacteria bacterium]|nr:hypothetical protein AGMMS49545_23460 [Betaproteobacteria bacterium]GHU43044.1 hypothetical protein AGMMS50289_08770 [Betaproteobacteria bacterium]
MLSDEAIDLITKRVEATQPGPWKSFVEGRDHTSGSSFIMTGEGVGRGEDIELSGATVADQDFIAAARQDVPLLLKEIRVLKALLGKPRITGCEIAHED